jgi:predicted DsbA family dithiol-disulfide isomerase
MTEGTLNRARVIELAASLGLDTARLEKDMQSPDIASAIRRTYALAEALSINATPAFIIGDELRLGALDRETLRALVARAREQKDK